MSTDPDGRSNGLTPTERLHLAFWERFTGEVAARPDTPLRTRSPTSGSNYKQYFLPGGDVRYDLFLDVEGGAVGCVLRFDDTDLLAYLRDRQDDVESSLGGSLEWRGLEDGGPAILQTRAADLDDRDAWPEYRQWLVNTGTAFEATFGPLVTDWRETQAD